MAEAMPNVAPDAVALPDGGPSGADTVVVDGVEYARADFERMPVKMPHLARCREAHNALRQAFDARPGDALVAEEINVYYDERQPGRAVVAPDVMVAVGVRQQDLDRYRVWEVGRPPSFVLEVLSSSTWESDLGPKKSIYARIGVREYFVLDGEGDLELLPRLQGFRLRAGDIPIYEPIPPWPAAECARRRAEVGYWCETIELGIALPLGIHGLRFYDPAAGDYLATAGEDHAGRARERARADQQQARADQQQARADQQQARADREKARADSAEARVAELERLLKGG